MMQKTWFKGFIWIMASAFFFFASVIFISELRPNPNEQQAMAYMMGMMSSMDGSLMGFSMSLENDNTIKPLAIRMSQLVIPLIVVSLFFSILLRFWRREVGK